jgi:DNA-binding response OmpR family regulator
MSGSEVTILIGSDDLRSLGDLADLLQAEGFKVISVSDRAAVVPLARSELPTLIVLDLHSSFDICRMLKRNFVTEPIPIIALLFPADEVDRVAVLELGADDCMAKPYSFRELTLRIRASLVRARDKNGQTRFKKAQHYAALTRPSSAPKPPKVTKS